MRESDSTEIENHSEEDRKKSQAYRLMKSYVIDAHVRRRIEDLNKKKKQKV